MLHYAKKVIDKNVDHMNPVNSIYIYIESSLYEPTKNIVVWFS